MASYERTMIDPLEQAKLGVLERSKDKLYLAIESKETGKVIGEVFAHPEARRVYMYTEDDNIACQKLCEKLGARQEGLFKEFVSFINDENGNPIYVNTYQYAILKKEWEI